jgi:hypothetical protein
MNLRNRLQTALESQREPIIIGAPQSLLTLNDALTSIKNDTETPKEEDAIVEPVDAIKGNEGVPSEASTDGDDTDPLADLDDGIEPAPADGAADEPVLANDELPVADEPAATEDELEEEAVSPIVEEEEAEEPVEETVEEEEASETLDEVPVEETEEVPEELEVEDDTDDEEEEDEADTELDEADDETEELEEAAKSLESIISAVHAQVRLGGMTPAIARVNEVSVNKVLAPIGMQYGKYAVSVESFAKDPIAVTMEAERSLKDLLLDIIKRIVAAVKESVIAFGKLMGACKEKAHILRMKVTSCAKIVSSLPMQPAFEFKQIDFKTVYNGFVKDSTSNSSIKDPVDIINKGLVEIVKTGEALRRYTLSCKVAVGNVINSVKEDGYKAGEYVETLSTIGHDAFKGVSLPGMMELGADPDTGSPVLKAGERKDDHAEQTCYVMSRPTMHSVLKEVSSCVDFLLRYVNSLEASQEELEDLIKVLLPLQNTQDAEDKGVLESVRAISTDLPAIIRVMRGGSRDYISYVYTSSARVLNYIEKNITAYKTA